ncbi:MAG: DUF3489 domain-containing protein [Terricaulis sp.]
MSKAPAKPRANRPATSAPKVKAAAPQSKLDLIVTALRKPKGATISALMALTGWQMHSVRGAIAGALKKKRGLNVQSAKTDKERVYRIDARS